MVLDKTGISWYLTNCPKGIKQYQLYKPMRKQSLRANVNEDEKKELEKVSEILDVPEAQIIREAVREKLEKLNRTHPKLKNRPELAEAI